jgi:Mor family transcriptional regulator
LVPERFEYAAGSLPSIKDAMQFILQLIYSDSQKIEKPEFKTSEKRERNAEIYRRYLAGEDSMVLSRMYGLSNRRIRNIIEKERKKGN